MSVQDSAGKAVRALFGKKHYNSPESVLSEEIELCIDDIHEHEDQARSFYGVAEMEALKNSIVEEGQLDAIHVYEDDSGKTIVVSGHRRLRAFRELGLSPIRAKKYPTEIQAKIGASSSNACREDVHPYDRGAEIRSLLACGAFDNVSKIYKYYGWSKSYAYYCNQVATLPECVARLVIEGGLRNRESLLGLVDTCNWIRETNPKKDDAELESIFLEHTTNQISRMLSSDDEAHQAPVLKKKQKRKTERVKTSGIVGIQDGMPFRRSRVISGLDEDTLLLTMEELKQAIAECVDRGNELGLDLK